MFLESIFEVKEVVKEFWMDIFNAFNWLVVNLILQIFLGNLISELLSSRYPLNPLTFLQSRRIDVLFLRNGEHEHVIEQLLKHLEQIFLLLGKEWSVQDVLHKLPLQNNELIHVTHLFQTLDEYGPSRLEHLH